MTRWWIPRCDIERGPLIGTYDWCFGEFLYARFPKKAVEFRQILHADGSFVPIERVIADVRRLRLTPSNPT